MSISFMPRAVNHGFDGAVSPAWQMVPVGGMRVLKLRGAGSRQPRVLDSKVATVRQTRSGNELSVQITGVTEGRTLIEWFASASEAGPAGTGFTLVVSVKIELRISTAFHYVSDGRKQVTKRKIEDLDRIVNIANAILTPQSNVKIMRRSAAALKIAQDLGQVVRYSAHIVGSDAAQHEWDDLLSHADASADFNVFFVREYEQDDTPLVDNVAAGTIAADKMCIFEDQMGTAPGEVLAHETLHLLGVSEHSKSWRHLSAADTKTGRQIPMGEADQINPSGT